jgi:hypothetical protein
MPTAELIERLQAARIDDRALTEARRLLAEAYAVIGDRGADLAGALGLVLGYYPLAAAVVGAADRVVGATKRSPRGEGQVVGVGPAAVTGRPRR